MAEPHKKVTFDPTINLGHILTFLGFVVGIGVSWSTLDKRLTIMEESRKTQEQIDRSQDQVASQNMLQIRESLGDIKASLGKLTDKLERK